MLTLDRHGPDRKCVVCWVVLVARITEWCTYSRPNVFDRRRRERSAASVCAFSAAFCRLAAERLAEELGRDISLFFCFPIADYTDQYILKVRLWTVSLREKVRNYNTVFGNVSRLARPVTYGELATWNWLSVVPSRRCDVCAAAPMMRYRGDDV